MKTTFDLFSNIAMQYGLIDSMTKEAQKAMKHAQFEEAMKLIDHLDEEALGALHLYISVRINNEKKSV